MNDSTWIKSYRKAQFHPIWVDKNAWRVFQWILWNVDYETGKGTFGRKQIAVGTGINESTVYKVTTRLHEKWQAIDMKSNNQFTEYSVLHWARYQRDIVKVTQSVIGKEHPLGMKSNTSILEYKNKELRTTVLKKPYDPIKEFNESLARDLAEETRLKEEKKTSYLN